MKITNRQMEIEEALHQINEGLAKLITIAGVKVTVDRLTLIPGVTTADKIERPGITVPGILPADSDGDIVVDGPVPASQDRGKPVPSETPESSEAPGQKKTILCIRKLVRERQKKGDCLELILDEIKAKLGVNGKELASIMGVHPGRVAEARNGRVRASFVQKFKNMFEEA